MTEPDTTRANVAAALCEWREWLEQLALRTLPAFAKAGRERYGIGPDTADRFDTCLAESADVSLPVTARAARAYLDVCFFHPFDDGNARSALLTSMFVLARAGIVPGRVGLLRGHSFHADDPRDALWCVGAVESITAESRP